MLSEVVTCNCVRNPGGHAESNLRPSEEGVSFYHVLRPLDLCAARSGCKLIAQHALSVSEYASIKSTDFVHWNDAEDQMKYSKDSQQYSMW